MEAARSEILARAYLERITAGQPRPTAEEIKKYYTDHPELFSQRRVFSLEEIAFVATEEAVAGLRDRVAKARSMQEIAEWLQAQGIKFAPNRGIRAAEQLPMEMLPGVQAMRDGDIQLLGTPDGRLQVIRVVASKSDPVDEAAAVPAIQQFLSNQRSNEMIAKEMKQIRDQAKIEYVGEFAGGVAAAETNGKAQANARDNAAAEAKAKEEKESKARAEALSKARAADKVREQFEREQKAVPAKAVQLPQQNIDKGVSGLK
jgi:hypothetical protein